MGIRIVPITKDSDAKRRKRTTSRIKGTPSEMNADDRRLLEMLSEETELEKLERIFSESGRTISNADRARMERMMRSGGGTAESTMSDDEKRSFIVDVQGIGANTAAGLSGDALKKAYEKALRDAEKDKKRGMGGAMVDELGYTRGVKLDREKRGAVKYSVGGAIKGKNFAGIF